MVGHMTAGGHLSCCAASAAAEGERRMQTMDIQMRGGAGAVCREVGGGAGGGFQLANGKWRSVRE
jgi:hypothetical protein